MMPNNIKVKIVYRNYTALHTLYLSLQTTPPEGIDFFIPKEHTWLSKLFIVYRRFKSFRIMKMLSIWVERIFFKNKPTDDFDYYYYIGILPDDPEGHKYVIDLEHVFFLTMNADDENSKTKLLNILQHDNCVAVAPLSFAAEDTLKQYLGARFSSIKKKVRVIYPAIPTYTKGVADYSIIPHDDSIKLLFVGKDSYRKGLHELIEAFKILSEKYPNLSLYVVSDASKEITSKTEDFPNLHFFPPKFKIDEIMTKFFLPSDIFVMPTHEDTFGMVFLEALASGTPIVTTKQFATTEIGESNVNTLFIDNPPLFLDQDIYVAPRYDKDYLLDPEDEKIIVDELVDKISRLIESPKLLDKLKSNSQKEFQNAGKFSIEKRNKIYKEIFK